MRRSRLNIPIRKDDDLPKGHVFNFDEKLKLGDRKQIIKRHCEDNFESILAILQKKFKDSDIFSWRSFGAHKVRVKMHQF